MDVGGMNILVLHNRYREAGGEDAVVAAETAMLRNAGHQVHVETVSNSEIRSPSRHVLAFLRAPFDAARADWLDALASRTGAELLHVHNFFPLLTPAVHQAASRRGMAVVQTLHNYRLLCANAQFLRDGKVCEACVHGSRRHAMVHRCYRGSVAATMAVVRMQAAASRLLYPHVNRFIALSEFARAKFLEGGLPSDRVVVKGNFAKPGHKAALRGGALFVGRLSPEKGLATLLSAWHSMPDVPLVIAGGGPLEERLRSEAPANVRFTGAIGPEAVSELMARSAVLIVPSIWYEGFPMVVAEAFAHGLPVIASDIGALSELVMDGKNGLLVPAGDANALGATVKSAFETAGLLETLAQGARLDYETRHNPAMNLKILEGIYRDALAETV
jgi:glycosyltransferase involved in cell wall biosynthesis